MKAKQVKVEVKEIRFGPQTDEHDYQFKLKHAKEFLEEGNKVRAYVFFRGRSILFKEQGEVLLLRFANDLEEFGKVESMPSLEGKKMFLYLTPKKAGVTVTKSGLQYEVLQEGTGKSPKATDTVRCHYEGRLLDGTIFDSSYKRGEPADFGLNQVIPGWTEGVQLMKEGAKFRFTIPYLLAYGEQGAGASIPPFSTLIFDVELIKVL